MMTNTKIADCRRIVDGLAREHAITIEWRDPSQMPAGVGGYASARKRRIVIPPIVDDGTYAVALHELAHVLEGECPEREPHRRDPRVTDWHHCLQCEADAWGRAMTLVKFTPAMHQRLRTGLFFYRHGTPAAATVKSSSDRLSSFLGYAGSVQAHLERDLFAEKKALVSRWRTEIDQQPNSVATMRARLARLT